MTLPPRGAPEREAAALLVTDDAGHVLLVRGPGRRASWALPGGTVADAGTPWDTAVHETARSVGLTPRPGGLLAVDWPRTPRPPAAPCWCSTAAASAARRGTASPPPGPEATRWRSSPSSSWTDGSAAPSGASSKPPSGHGGTAAPATWRTGGNRPS
ncbi:NUDIX domain-containing protein [Streptomyces hazeniae]|uniref:NUDIX domain-containing protein n=1 Tax=Streptomyces hazeniae TaxID=3075538 RepID=UPI00374E01C0